jgi:SSS family solute:Na+ symporter
MGSIALRPADLVVLGIGFVVMILIGGYFARRSKSAEAYFLAGRSMPGWVVGFSMMATIVSTGTFLTLPAYTYEFNWAQFIPNMSYAFALVVAVLLFVPFYRRANINSAYEYLERRFGTWARLYAATCFVLFHVFRTGLILYAVGLAVQVMLGEAANDYLPLIFCVLGILVAAYTIAGGLQAVIWTDLLQGIALIGGGLICLPIILRELPGGFEQIFALAQTIDDQGNPVNKMSMGDTSLVFTKKTLWVLLLSKIVIFLQLVATDQTSVQRYCAAKSDKEARTAVIIGGLLTLPVWTYFFFVGSALYAFYQAVPDEVVRDLKPDQVFPHFILTQVPAGFAGFVIMGLLAAALSTLDSSINAMAATVTNDFYGRLLVRNKKSEHYALVGRVLSLVFGMVMIGAAIGTHLLRAEQAIEDIQTKLLSICSGGPLGLFLLGFFTWRARGRAASIATALTVIGVVTWVTLDGLGIIAVGPTGFLCGDREKTAIPDGMWALPDTFWVGVFSNVGLLAIGYILSWLLGGKDDRDLSGLTVWTRTKGGK